MIRKLALCGVSALALSAIAASANADPLLPNLQNLDFLKYSGTTPKGSFTAVNPQGWTGGTGLIFIASNKTFNQSAAGPVYLTTYGNPTGTYNGNYVEADGNPFYESSFNYTVKGLTPGQTYTLGFNQGASQQAGFHGDTTDQWIVALTTPGNGLYVASKSDPTTPNNSCGTDCGYFSNDSTASIVASPLMTVPSGSTVGFNFVTVNLTADAKTDVLSFLAWGDNGNTTNLPPIAFLGGVDSPNGVPEPAALALLGVGLAGVAAVARRRRKA